jgi:U3 small nucleolar ribonucleoprotein protein IMP3|eukprot:TRINITY_DN7413_c0_g1_i3.p1 TRINITY_DN7413_c0_g1~~TRINITY_DN7413_c0_g1_i3.p1  ORF type:complete len:205 (+),score=116.81 TRINITY_DN7413_c0_g1_i3:63-617(+)
MRPLKYHESKLLKKVDFVNNWKTDRHARETEVIRRYHVQRREDYLVYNRLCGQIEKVANQLRKLPGTDEHRIRATDALLDKLYGMGLIPTKKNLSQCERVTVSAFCRRRLPIVMVRLKMAENVREAVRFVEQGHVRVGPSAVTDPAFLVTRNLEDFLTWVDSSRVRRAVMKYNDRLDDFDLLQA